MAIHEATHKVIHEATIFQNGKYASHQRNLIILTLSTTLHYTNLSHRDTSLKEGGNSKKKKEKQGVLLWDAVTALQPEAQEQNRLKDSGTRGDDRDTPKRYVRFPALDYHHAHTQSTNSILHEP